MQGRFCLFRCFIDIQPMVERQTSGPLHCQKQQQKHPKKALVENERVGVAVEPTTNRSRINIMAENIGQRLHGNKANHGQRRATREQANDNQKRQNNFIFKVNI